jgi:hypothetical protein
VSTRLAHLQQQAYDIQNPLPDPPLPPLTAEEFRAGTPYVHKGIHLIEDESGEWVYAYGHEPAQRFAAAVNEYDDAAAGPSYTFPPEEQYTRGDVQHRWAVTVEPADGPDGWRIDFRSSNTATTPGAFPVTVVSR